MKSRFDLSVEGREALARLLSEEGVDQPASRAIRRREVRNRGPLSYEQKRLWFLYEFEADKALYNIPTALRLTGPPDVRALRQALAEILRRHEVLRTSIAESEGDPVQIIHPEIAVELPVADLEKIPPDQREQELSRRITAEALTPFDLRRAPLLRALLLRLNADDHVLTLTLHHIAGDGWSLQVLARELGILYEAFSHGRPSPPEELPVQYADYAVWQQEWLQGAVEEKQLAYWRKQLAAMPGGLDLPMAGPRPVVPDHHGALHTFLLPSDLVAGLKELGRKEGVTQFIILLTALQVLLGRYSGEADIAVGTPIAGRTRAETEAMIGFFVNTLVIRTDLSGNPSFSELLGRVRETALGAYSHQDLPFERLVEDLHLPRERSRTPLFQVMLVLLNDMQARWKLGDLQVREQKVELEREKFDLTVQFLEHEEQMEAEISYRTELFDAVVIHRMAGHLQLLLRAMVASPDSRLAEIDLLSPVERRQILVEWNATARTYPEKLCIHQLFERQAERSPEAPAVVFEDCSIRYRELNERANQLANYLRELGIGPESLVGICIERSVEMVVGLLAILKAGGAYVPMDPNYPAERLAYMLEDAGVRVLLTQAVPARERLGAALDKSETLLVCMDHNHDIIRCSTLNPSVPLDSENLAYMIYTSGSTGRPKGVMVPHAALVNFLLSMRRQPGIEAGDVLLAVTTISFDIAALELYLPLTVGAQVRILNREAAMDGARLLRELQSGVTMMQATPASWQMLLDAGWNGTETLRALCGGEALSADLAEKLIPRTRSLRNMYGPTETTVWSLMENMDSLGDKVTLGRPIDNTRVYILDDRYEPPPASVVGEIYIGGNGVARGYLNRPELTAERFLPDPFAAENDAPPGRIYKTGDLGRWLDDGKIEFVGRNDFQVKIRGFRIELGEIERRLTEHEAVSRAVVIAREDTPGDKRLIAYYTRAAEKLVTTEELRRHLAEKLPDYMVPAACVQMESLPLTANGKLDRKALPAPQGTSQAAHAYEAPEGEVETALAGIWKDVLRLPRVGRHDNFFELGGHSLLVMKIVARTKTALGVEVPVRLLFEQSTIALFGKAIPGQASGPNVRPDSPIPRIPRESNLPLSLNQHGRLLVEWWAEMRSARSAPFHLFQALSLDPQIDIAALERALNAMVQRHEILRTGFSDPKKMTVSTLPAEIAERLRRIRSGELITAVEMRDFVQQLIFGESIFRQTIYTAVNLRLRQIDLDDSPPERRDSELLRIAAEAVETPFDYEAAPLVRALLFKRSGARDLLLIVMPHLLGDGWSLEIFRDELALLYDSFACGVPCLLPELTIQSVDFAAWQRNELQGPHLEAMLEYWKQRWSEFSLFDIQDIPSATPLPESPGFIVDSLSRKLDRNLCDRLRMLAGEKNITLHMLCLTALNILLHLYSGRERIGVWNIFANRIRPETEGLMGWLANGYVMGVRFVPEQTIGELLFQVRDVVLDAQSRQEIPAALLWSHFMKDLDRNPGSARAPVQPHISFVTETRPAPQTDAPIQETQFPYNTGSLALRFVVIDEPPDIGLFNHYSIDRFTHESIDRMMADLQTVLEKIAEDSSAKISKLAGLPFACQADAFPAGVK